MPELLSFGRLQGLKAALHAIANHLVDIPGPKSLIWLASVFPRPFDEVDARKNPIAETERRNLLAAVNQLLAKNVAIYPVDARGLMPDISFNAENDYIPLGPDSLNEMFGPNLSAPLELASHSGGRAYVNTNGFLKSFADVISATNASYTLGFYTSETADDKFHPLQISTAREGVHLQYRPGYWHMAIGPESGSQVQDDLRVALDSPFTAEEIDLQADAKYTSSSRAMVALFIDPDTLTLTRKESQWMGTVTIIFGQKDRQGRVFAVPPQELPIDLPDKVRRQGMWIKWRAPIELRKNSTDIRIAVVDNFSRRTGSVDIPLQ